MLKYTGKYWFVVSTLLRKPLKKAYGKEVASKALKQGKEVYRDMLAKVDDLGDDNPMAKNVYMSFAMMAIWEAADGAITPEGLTEIVTDVMSNETVMKFMGGMDLNKSEDRDRLYSTLRANKQWADDHPQYRDATWDFNFDDEKHRDGIYYHYTRCPIEKFARENGFMEVLPVGCSLDYPNARAKHAILHRDQTLATGGTMCDFWLAPDQIENPQ
ncbi:MAG: L-2-amino-thiazoline-4-carboxylic acid hydrolase [Eggerthellaceae bacterium]|nr:L-2-amino-thiazoline-4-carboxylic acid hydrolase [Eggerthellaceae bacterium]